MESKPKAQNYSVLMINERRICGFPTTGHPRNDIKTHSRAERSRKIFSVIEEMNLKCRNWTLAEESLSNILKEQ
jgi:hypothetical protein